MEDFKILTENIIKAEDMKEEPNDLAEEDVWNRKGGQKPFSLKSEVKEEYVEEEELPCPETVTVEECEFAEAADLFPSQNSDPLSVAPFSLGHSFESPFKLIKEELEDGSKDPLAISNGNSLGRREWSVGGGCNPEGTIISETQTGSDVQVFDDFSIEGNDVSLVKAGVEPKEAAARNKAPTDCASRFLNSNNARDAEEHIVCLKRLSEGKSERENTQRERRCHECSLCKKNFNKKAYLVKHMRIHSGERPFQCCVCHKNFKNKSYLVIHMRIHTKERPYECSVCEKSFRHRYNLVTHKRIHSGERPYECSVCEKTFTRRNYIVTHTRIHSGERPYECSVCQKSFIQREHLVSHMRTHSGERPYKCSVCVKSFAQRRDLVTHIRIHSGERPYQCSVCEKSFTRRHDLDTHTRKHSGERPYECSACEKNFTRRGDLVTHMRIHN